MSLLIHVPEYNQNINYIHELIKKKMSHWVMVSKLVNRNFQSNK